MSYIVIHNMLISCLKPGQYIDTMVKRGFSTFCVQDITIELARDRYILYVKTVRNAV